MILFQNIDVYAPEYLGRKDVLTVYDKIVKIADAGTITADGLLSGAETVDGTGLVLTPGFVDCHVHVLGGGGELCQPHPGGDDGRPEQVRCDNRCRLPWN